MSSGEVELLSTLLGILLVCVGYLLWFHCRVVCTFAIFKKDTQEYFRVAFARLDALEEEAQHIKKPIKIEIRKKEAQQRPS